MLAKIVGVAVVAVFLAGSAWWEYSLWAECRSDHSVFYCLRVLGK